jgi:hypothetical protein
MFVFRNGKNYTNAFGGNNANTPNKQQTTTSLFDRAPLNYGSGFICFYLQKG